MIYVTRAWYSNPLDDKMINIRTSRYRNDAITQMSDVRQARFLGQAVDTQALEQINQTIYQLEHRLAGLKATYDVVIKEEDAIKQKREVLLTQKKELHQILGDLRVVKSRLDRINQQINNCQKEAIDLDAEERIVKEKCGVNRRFEFILFFVVTVFTSVLYVSDVCANHVDKNERKLWNSRPTSCTR